ncbi:MAG: hypothetical protein U0T81_02155 [Saprospiraceae bacterium]
MQHIIFLEVPKVSLSNNAATYKTFLLKRTDTTLTNLNKGIKYAWRVTAFNATSLWSQVYQSYDIHQ